MSRTIVVVFSAFLFLSIPSHDGAQKVRKATPPGDAPQAVLWTQPADIAALDTMRGPGGGSDLPQGPVQFVSEDMNGSNPKFDVKAADGTKWQVKMGDETRPETAADHLLWAVGYSVPEDYFVPVLHVEGLPAHLKRGQNLVGPGSGEIHNARLKRMDGKKLGTWSWKSNPFLQSHEFNGLRVMMCMINNWDLKDENNAQYLVKGVNGASPRDVYVVTDLGSSFGTTGQSWSGKISKGNEANYVRTTFITKVTPTTVSFKDPTLPPLPIMLRFVGEAPSRVDMEWLKRDVPRADAEWVGALLAQLTPRQLSDVFRSAGFSEAEIDGFASNLKTRIDALNHLDGYPNAAGASQ